MATAEAESHKMSVGHQWVWSMTGSFRIPMLRMISWRRRCRRGCNALPGRGGSAVRTFHLSIT